MPNIKSAKKRVLVIEKKTLQNKSIRTKMRSTIKKFNNFIDTLKLEEAENMLSDLMSTIDLSAKAGIIHKSTASNYKSRLCKRLSSVKSGKIIITIKKDNKTIAAERAQKAREAREAATKLAKEQQAAKAEQKAAEKAAKEAAAAAIVAEQKAAEKAAKKATKKTTKKED